MKFGNKGEKEVRKLLILCLSVFFLSACGNDEYADLRKMTVQDYLDNRVKMEEVLDKCSAQIIKDKSICETAREAVSNIHDIW